MPDQAEKLRELVNIHNNHKKSSSGARIIAVTSGKGGVGKTNLAVNLSIHLSHLGQKVTLIDTDLGLANIDLILGISPEYHLGHFVSGERRLSEIIIEGPSGVKVIPGGSGFQELADINEYQLDKCLNQISCLEAETDIIILDTGAGISSKVVHFILAAEEVIVVTTPEPTAIADAYGVIKVLARRNSAAKVYIVVNMVQREEEGEQVLNRLVMVAEKFLDFRVEPLGMVFYDSSVMQAVRQQQPFSLIFPQTKASLNVLRLAQIILSLPEVTPGGLVSFWRRLIKR